jgi:hypothetical protein
MEGERYNRLDRHPLLIDSRSVLLVDASKRALRDAVSTEEEGKSEQK